MKGILKTDIRLTLLISLSYFIFWWIVVFISAGAQVNHFLKGAGIYSWQIIYVTLINLYLHLLAIPFVKTRKIKWPWYILIVASLFVLLIPGFNVWNSLGALLTLFPPTLELVTIDWIVKSFLFQLFGMGYFACIKLFIDSFKLKLKNQQLDIEKKVSELNYLKSQTHPHFLFNTLNNIYSLTRTKSDLAPVSVLRLSDILRYMLYEIENGPVLAVKEIKVLEDYIELEKIRYDETLDIKFIVDTDNPLQEIPPLLMIPLVENAFKHGTSETADLPFIHIHLTISNNTLHFTVENSREKSRPVMAVKENIGLRNLRRQLELQFTDYRLSLEEKETTFFVSMYINLDSYAKN